MFKKFVIRIANATTYDQLMDILYGEDGVDMAYQREKLNWKDHEILFTLAAAHKASDFTCPAAAKEVAKMA